MSEGTERTHPDEATWIAWLDEPSGLDPDVERHLAACGTCAATVRELRAVLDGLGEEPTMPGPEELAANRERIREAIDAPAGAGASRAAAWRPAAWAVLLAAAALAGLLLWSPRAQEPPASTSERVTAAPGSPELVLDPVAEEAERAAEEIVAAALPTSGSVAGDEVVYLDDDATEALARIESATPTDADVWTDESTELAERFAALPEKDRNAILDELSDPTLEL